MFKLILQHSNRMLSRYNHSDTPSLWTFWHKWNYQHTLVKNLLQFSNRVMKQVNRYHVFRWDWMVGIAGAATGFIVIQLEQIYYQIKIGYKPTTSNIVIQGVLKNQAVSNKLKQVLNNNVFFNQEIQYYVHQAFINQVICPQKQQIKLLIKSFVSSMSTKQNIPYFAEVLAGNVPILKKPIQDAALQFLDSPTMDSITANGLKSVLQSLFFKQFLANQINSQIKTYLSDNKNGQYLYQLAKEKFSL